jgi:hypothetical protein
MYREMTKAHAVLVLAAALALTTLEAGSASAEVRFGKNVRVGGHDVSDQTFNSRRRGLYVIHSGRPSRPGCRWVSNRDGSKTKICHLQRKSR